MSEKSKCGIKSKYQLQLVNTASLSTVASVRVARWVAVVVLLMVIVGIGALWYVAFRYTPIRTLLPERVTTVDRDNYERMLVRLDSLTAAAEINARYLDNLSMIFADSLTIADADTAEVKQFYDLPIDSLIGATDAERKFVEKFESQERFNVSTLAPVAAGGMHFFPPVEDGQRKQIVTDRTITATSISAGRATPVASTYKGTVVATYYSTDNGITVIIQHPNDFMSVYSGLGDVLVSRGSKVSSGERIGVGRGDDSPIRFELWHDGAPLDANEYVTWKAIAVKSEE